MILVAQADLEQQIISLALRTVTSAAIALVILVLISAAIKDRMPKLKLPIFVLIAFTMVGTTAVLLTSTIYLNVKSESGGPVHWHSEIEFWSCGAELNLRDPVGFLSNKIGTATYHEHNDKHIHLEGVVVQKSHDASLGKFMEVTGGYINHSALAIPLNKDQETWFTGGEQLDGDGQRPENFGLATNENKWITNDQKGAVLALNNGEYCSGSHEKPAEVQVFVYSFDKATNTYAQRKLDSPAEYVMREESSLGPPSDCVIVEYDQPKTHTDKLCEQYGVKDADRCIEFGVKEYDGELCNIREVRSTQ